MSVTATKSPGFRLMMPTMVGLGRACMYDSNLAWSIPWSSTMTGTWSKPGESLGEIGGERFVQR